MRLNRRLQRSQTNVLEGSRVGDGRRPWILLARSFGEVAPDRASVAVFIAFDSGEPDRLVLGISLVFPPAAAAAAQICLACVVA